ncbi:MAG: hypothetical protein IMF09_09015 [Proteobacteria bacterium]|nr:hypothetical protein [Pseudomonadota bacterium]
MNINLHIERLVLDGVNIAPGERHLLRSSVTTELTRMLNNGGLAHNLIEGVDLPRLSTRGIQLNNTQSMELAQQIAQSVYGGIGHE